MTSNIKIQGYSELERSVGSLIKYIDNPLSTFKFARLIMLQDVFDHFTKEESPEGAWQPLKIIGMSESGKITSYRLRKGEATSSKILQDTGRLRNSITGVVSSKGAEVGTNLVYAKTHQYGDPKRNIPQRTFVWLSKQAQERIFTKFIKDMKDVTN